MRRFSAGPGVILVAASIAAVLLPPIGRAMAQPGPRDRATSSAGTTARLATAAELVSYPDGRPAARFRLEARDQGVVLRHGDGPDRCDELGARDVWAFESGGRYYLQYDGAGPRGWLSCLATSSDLVHWAKQGKILDLGAPDEGDSRSASYAVTYHDGKRWHMFYLGTRVTSPPPNRIPFLPYRTMKAQATSPGGPWTKRKDVVPFGPKPGTYYSGEAFPGAILRQGDGYLMFFSPARQDGGPFSPILRTIGLARTKDLDGPWTLDPQPILPLEEQIESSALYYEPANRTWFLFTDHIAVAPPDPERKAKGPFGDAVFTREYCDAVWIYWSQDLEHWKPEHKAVVLDGRNCTWSPTVIGAPSILQVGNRLALFYDGCSKPGDRGHMHRDVGLAWLELPLNTPHDQP
jgi:hypothetical protein